MYQTTNVNIKLKVPNNFWQVVVNRIISDSVNYNPCKSVTQIKVCVITLSTILVEEVLSLPEVTLSDRGVHRWEFGLEIQEQTDFKRFLKKIFITSQEISWRFPKS